MKMKYIHSCCLLITFLSEINSAKFGLNLKVDFTLFHYYVIHIELEKKKSKTQQKSV